MTTPVSFEIAKSLKEKGFDYHLLYNDFANYYDYFDRSVQGRLHVSDFPENKFPDENKWTPVPYIHQVVMWLYEKHGIWISAIPYNDEELSQTLWENKTIHISDDYNDFSDYTFYHSPTEAYEAAIEYTLKNLI